MALLQHTLGIMLRPGQEWRAIRAEKHSFIQIFISHVPLLALIPVVAAYFGVTRVGWAIGDGETIRLTAQSALSLCALTYVALLAGVYLFGEFINWMSRTYGVDADAHSRHYAGTALAVFVTTPIFLAGICFAYPLVWFNALVMFAAVGYSVYLIYEGIPVLMNLSREQAFMYATSVITAGLVLAVTLLIGTVILWGLGMGPVYTDI